MTDRYLNRITSLHRQQPKFTALVDAVIRPLVEVQDVLEQVRRAFDLDDAVGVQLDKIGEWVGRTRRLALPLTDVYFTWDTDGLGWGQGSWQGLFDPTTGLVDLPDDMYRVLLKAKVAANGWDGTRDGAYEIWEAAFADTGLIILLQDHQDMTISIGVAGSPPSAILKALLTQGYIPLKPAGVEVTYYAVATSDTGALFAWDCDSDALAGWGLGSWPEILKPMENANAA